MNHTSPYMLLSALDDWSAAPVVDLPALAERWRGTHRSPAAHAAHAAHAAPLPSPVAPTQESAPVSGPRMRTPAPMYPPTAYPSGIPTYNSAPQPTRHAHYDAILEQHRNAAKNAVFTSAPIE